MNSCYPFINTPLPYAFDALEPYIDAKTMELHHDRHLQTYINNLNTILQENPALQKFSLEELLSSLLLMPQKIQMPVANNAGGIFNHRFFFDGMCEDGGKLPNDSLSYAINAWFGSFPNFQEQFKAAALSVFGSGYAWLLWSKGQLKIATTANQNTPLIQGMTPLLNLDVWEHAYYLKHYNLRADYIDDWFHTVNYEKVQQRYRQCQRK